MKMKIHKVQEFVVECRLYEYAKKRLSSGSDSVVSSMG